MFFKRKTRNRRFQRHHILDVKLSAIQRRRSRLRRLVLFAGMCVSVFAGLLIVWRGGEWLMRRGLYENRAFAIHQLNVETDGVLSREQIRSWAGVRLTDNLLALNLARVKRDLELVPAIESVAVERVLPHTLRIRVTEREPIARTFLPNLRAAGVTNRGVYTLDGAGYFMFPLEAAQRAIPAQTDDHLPVLVGIPVADIRPGRRAESPQVLAALRLISAFDRSPMAGVVDLKEIDLANPGMLVARTAQSNAVVFGLSDPEPQLRRWRAVHDHAQKTSKHLAWLDLSVANNIPAQFVEATFVPPPARKPQKPSPYRKKHV
jgi:hypothetical protein